MNPSKNKSPSAKRNEGVSVRERVLAAVKVLEASGDLGSMTISAACRAAQVSRANLYISHKDLLAEMSARFKARRSRSSSVREERSIVDGEQELKERLAQSDERYKKLLLVCAEQQAEINWLRLKLKSSVSPTRRKEP